MNLNDTRIEVIPNGHNESGCVFVIYARSSWFPFVWREIGRVFSIGQLREFAYAVSEFHGKSLKAVQ